MNQHVAIGLAVLGVILAGAGWRRWKRRSGGLPARFAARLDVPVQEMLSPSGRFKAVAYEHDGRAYRVEVFRLVDGEQDERFWHRISGPSFADRARLAAVLEDGLRAASGESFAG